MGRITPSAPLREADFALLEAELAGLKPRITLDGWDDCPPLYASPCPAEGVEGAWFDVRSAVKAVRAIASLRHTKGRWAGAPLVPDAWQVVWALAPVFGYRHAMDRDDELAGTRIVRTAYIEVPRKAGKSTLSSGCALVLLCADGEMGAEVYSAAADKAQASIVFGQSKSMAMASPTLAPRIRALKEVIEVPSTGSVFRVLSKVAEAAHGLNVHGAVIDELHVHKSRDLVDAIETGVGARLQPLILIITTADEAAAGTIYDEKHNHAIITRQGGSLRDPSFFGVVWAAADDENPYDPATWYKAQPGLGRTVTRSYYEDHARRAQANRSYEPTYKRLFLNVRSRAETRWLNLADWDQPANAEYVWLPAQGETLPAQLKGRRAWGGLDLSSKLDVTALTLWVPDDDHRAGWLIPWLWLPEDGLAERVARERLPWDQWAEQGYLQLTEGNVVDYDSITEVLDWCADQFELLVVGHDRWQAGPVVHHLANRGTEGVPIPQTYSGMSAGAKELEALAKRGALRHQGHPIMRWMADVVEVITDQQDNMRPVKPDRKASGKRVDGITAAVMSLGSWLHRPDAAVGGMAAVGADGGSTVDIYAPGQRLEV